MKDALADILATGLPYRLLFTSASNDEPQPKPIAESAMPSILSLLHISKPCLNGNKDIVLIINAAPISIDFSMPSIQKRVAAIRLQLDRGILECFWKQL